jgi:hypothetical protein
VVTGENGLLYDQMLGLGSICRGHAVSVSRSGFEDLPHLPVGPDGRDASQGGCMPGDPASTPARAAQRPWPPAPPPTHSISLAMTSTPTRPPDKPATLQTTQVNAGPVRVSAGAVALWDRWTC